MKKLLLLIGLLVSVSGFSASKYVDSASLYQCGGRVELRESSSNLHLQFRSVRNCSNLIVKNAFGRVLKQYAFNKGGTRAPYSPNYTLSNQMWRELGRGKLVLLITGNGNRETVYLRVNPFGGSHDPSKCGGHSSSNYTGYARTGSCKCGYYVRGQFKNSAPEYKCRNL